jgi:cytidine deaminase
LKTLPIISYLSILIELYFKVKHAMMEEIQLSINMRVKTMSQLSVDELKVVNKAIQQLDLAYAPYSNFHVGAAVLIEGSDVFGGSNQENASYPLCMCGERVALYHTAMAAPNAIIKAIAITARNEKVKMLKPVMPCGACRQVILEYEQRNGQDIQLLFKADDDHVYILGSAKDLLPFYFDASFL